MFHFLIERAMISVENHIDNIVGFTLEGKIEEGEIEAIGKMMEEKLKTHDKVRMYAEIDNLKGYDSASAFFKDMKYTLKLWNKIEKAAIVADPKWIDNLTNLADLLTPGDIKHFPPAEKTLAMQWLKR
jgi:hypothetical protein